MDATSELLSSLERILSFSPPDSSASHRCTGLYRGSTSTAFSFYALSKLYPGLKVSSKPLQEWASLYLEPGKLYLSKPRHATVDASRCGVANELLAHTAVSAVVYSDRSLAEKLCSYVSQVLIQTESHSNEWLYGVSGYLYLLRLVRKALPDLKWIEESTQQLIELILSSPLPWKWHGSAFLGAVHGSVGIIAQVVLSDPSSAPKVETMLSTLLDLQLPSGNFPSSLEKQDDDRLVQFCHGSPGFVIALVSIGPHVPKLRSRIDAAIEKARMNIWEKGLLTKEPSLCHGIAGNALALDVEQRNTFMRAMTTQALSEQWKKTSEDEKADSLYTGEPGRAWVWGVVAYERELNGICLGFNDV